MNDIATEILEDQNMNTFIGYTRVSCHIISYLELMIDLKNIDEAVTAENGQSKKAARILKTKEIIKLENGQDQ